MDSTSNGYKKKNQVMHTHNFGVCWYTKKLKKTRKNGIVEYHDYQIPVTQLNQGPKGYGDMQAVKLCHLAAVDRFTRYGGLEWEWQTFF